MAPKRPNIILFLTDDMGYSDIGCFGSEINTPNLDALADSGLRYTQMYNNARCCPSRASLLTGLYPHMAGIGHMNEPIADIPEYQGYLNNQCITVAEGLRDAGYRTGMVGKWHVGGFYKRGREEVAGQKGYPLPNQRGFELFWGTLEGTGDYYNPVTLMEDGEWQNVTPEDDFYYTEQIAAKGCGMVEEFTADGDPFFLYVAFSAPHWPLHAREEYIKKYEGKYLDGWDEARKRRFDKLIRQGIISADWDMSPRDEDAQPWDEVEDKAFEDIKMAVYAAQVEQMDAAVGRLMAKVRETGQEDNTLVIFLSDNGACAESVMDWPWMYNLANEYTLTGDKVAIGNSHKIRPGGEDTFMSYGLPWANMSNAPFRLFKHWIHEGGISTPMIVNWPQGLVRQGEIEHTPLHFVDVLPTLFDIARAEYPVEYKGEVLHPVSGESFAPSFTGAWARERPIFWEHEGNCGVRLGRYKLVRKHPLPFELYDMETDRTELHDLAAALPEETKRLAGLFTAWMEKAGVKDWDYICALPRG